MDVIRMPDNRGQYFPLTAQILFAAMIVLIASVNVYRIARAKLQAQNMADAAALAIAALEAKEINVVIDRNEWLNHMYSTDDPNNQHRLPNISQADKWKSGTQKAVAYAQLVATINKAQIMFIAAYNRFLGADQGQVPGQSTGPGGLADILSEIDGLQEPGVRVMVFNTNQGAAAAQEASQKYVNGAQAAALETGGERMPCCQLAPIQFKIEDVTYQDSDKNARQTLAKALQQPSDTKIGWMHPVWDDPNSTMRIKAGRDEAKQTIGAGVIVIKPVPLLFPLIRRTFVRATASAYVVRHSGLSIDKNGASGSGGSAKPPDHFRPTYYVNLGYPK